MTTIVELFLGILARSVELLRTTFARFDTEGDQRYPKENFLPDLINEDLKYCFSVAFSGTLAAVCRRG